MSAECERDVILETSLQFLDNRQWEFARVVRDGF